MNLALLIIFVFLALAIYLSIHARRGFGTLFVFLLLAGEIYTTFTFLGTSGWAYGWGGSSPSRPRARAYRGSSRWCS